MPSYTYGGQSKTDFYRVKWNGTAYQVLDKLTDTVATAPTTTNVAASLDYISSTKVAFQDDGSLQLSWDQYELDDELIAFCDKVAKASSGANLQEVTLENGTKIGGSTATGELVLAISYLNYDDPRSPSKVLVVAAIGTISPTSLSFDTSAENLTKPTIEFKSIKTQAAFTIVSGMQRATIVTAADQTLPANSFFLRKYVNKA